MGLWDAYKSWWGIDGGDSGRGRRPRAGFNPNSDWDDWMTGTVRRSKGGHPQQVWERKEQMWMARIFSDPSIKRMMSEEGRAAMFGDMANQYDQSYRQARTAGIGGLALSGVSGSGATALLKGRLARDRAGGLAEAESRATMAHADWTSNFLGGLMSGHFGRMLQFQGLTDQKGIANKEMMGAAMGGVGQGLGMWASGGFSAAASPPTPEAPGA